MEQETNKVKITKYKLSEYDEEELQNLLKKVLQFCQVRKLPVFISAATTNNEKETVYTNLVYSGATNYINLKDDKIRKYMLVANNFEVVPPREVVTFDMEDF